MKKHDFWELLKIITESYLFLQMNSSYIYIMVLTYMYAVLLFEHRPKNEISNLNCSKSLMLWSTD